MYHYRPTYYYQLTRYATEEQAAEVERLRKAIDKSIDEQIEDYRQQWLIGKEQGLTDDEIRQRVAARNNTPAIKQRDKVFNKLVKDMDKVIDTLVRLYIKCAAEDIPTLLKDAEAKLASFNDYIQEWVLVDILADSKKAAEKKGKTYTEAGTIKDIIEGEIYAQRSALRHSKIKTKQDKAALDNIVQACIDTFLERITPEIRKQVDAACKEPVEKGQLLKPIEKTETFYTPNSYIAGNFMDILKGFYQENNGQMSFIPQSMEIDITGRGKGSIPVMLSINYEGDITKEGTNSIDYNRARIQGFDTAVLDAICTILETGQNDVYISAIDSLLKGGTKVRTLSEKREERLLLAIRKLSGTRVRLDITNELKAKYDFAALDLKEGVLDAAMLEYTGLELTTYAGIKTHVIHVEKMPAIYQYSKAKGEITSFPTALLETGERAEERFTTLKIALLKRITLINKRIMTEKTILFESLYRAAGLEEHENKSQRKRERDALIDMLLCWKKAEYIKGYESYYKGKSCVGFKIEPHYIKQ